MPRALRAPADPQQPADESPYLPGAGISRDSLHKRRATGGKQKAWRKKRK